MTTWGRFRLLAIAVTFFFGYLVLFSDLVDRKFGSYLWFAVTDIFLYSHYVLAFSNRATFNQVKGLNQHPRGRWLFYSILLISAISVIYEPELTFLFFAFHFAFGETYSRILFEGDRAFYIDKTALRRSFRLIQSLFLIFTYFYAGYHTFYYVQKIQFVTVLLTEKVVLTGFILFGTSYFLLLLFKAKKIFADRPLNDIFFCYILPELLFIPVAIIMHEYIIHWSAAVLYHIIFWGFYPFLTAYRTKKYKQLIFKNLFPTLVITTFFVLIFPGFLTGTPTNTEYLMEVGYIGPTIPFAEYYPDVISQELTNSYIRTMAWGVFHILFSLILSSLNPSFIRKFSSENLRDPWMA